ncbi:MAG: hypothetical protein IJ574_04025 [Bacilli bacterium]|nr:hypothetical protein [Bacilli bacterium]
MNKEVNNDNKKRNKKAIYVVLIGLILFNLIFWYGFFIFGYGSRFNDGGAKTNTVIQTGVLDLEIKGGNAIKINNAKILNQDEINTKSSKFNFKVYHSSKSTVDNAIYYINLSDIKMTNNLKSKYFNWSLQNNGKVLAQGTFAKLNGNNIKLNEDGIILPKENTDNLTLTLWLVNDLNVNQNDLLHGNFSANITMESYVYN